LRYSQEKRVRLDPEDLPHSGDKTEIDGAALPDRQCFCGTNTIHSGKMIWAYCPRVFAVAQTRDRGHRSKAQGIRAVIDARRRNHASPTWREGVIIEGRLCATAIPWPRLNCTLDEAASLSKGAPRVQARAKAQISIRSQHFRSHFRKLRSRIRRHVVVDHPRQRLGAANSQPLCRTSGSAGRGQTRAKADCCMPSPPVLGSIRTASSSPHGRAPVPRL